MKAQASNDPRLLATLILPPIPAHTQVTGLGRVLVCSNYHWLCDEGHWVPDGSTWDAEAGVDDGFEYGPQSRLLMNFVAAAVAARAR